MSDLGSQSVEPVRPEPAAPDAAEELGTAVATAAIVAAGKLYVDDPAASVASLVGFADAGRAAVVQIRPAPLVSSTPWALLDYDPGIAFGRSIGMIVDNTDVRINQPEYEQ